MRRASILRTSLPLLAAAAFFPAVVVAYVSPGRPAGYVNDFAHVLSAETSASIEASLTGLAQSTGAEVAVVTVPSLGGETVETYAAELFKEWGIGNEKEDTGLLILVAPNDREARIEVGYGLEGALTDLQAGRIVQDLMIPAFKEGNYDAGVTAAVNASVALISDSPEAEQYRTAFADRPRSSSGGGDSNIVALLFFIVFGLNLLARALGRTKSWWLGGLLGTIAGVVIGLVWGFLFIGAGAMIGLGILGLLFDWLVSRKGPGGPGGRGGGFWWFGGPGSGGFGGGGFGGFGGGMSGGGGASGRW